MDTSDILEGQQVNHYLTMVGQLQWLTTLGRFDTQAQVITMSRFWAQPGQGHLERLKRIYAYVIRTKDYATRFRTTEPDYSYLPDQILIVVYKIYYTSIYIFYILFTSRQVEKFKNYKNPPSASKVIKITRLNLDVFNFTLYFI